MQKTNVKRIKVGTVEPTNLHVGDDGDDGDDGDEDVEDDEDNDGDEDDDEMDTGKNVFYDAPQPQSVGYPWNIVLGG